MINNAFYDELSARWLKGSDHPVALLRAENKLRNPWIRDEIAKRFSNPVSVLDIGCGAGFLTNDLATARHRVFGIDLSKESLRIAKESDITKTVDYQIANAYTLPFPDASFETVCAMDVLEHVEEPLRLIEEAARVLKPGGLFFFHTFNRNPLSYLIVIKGVEWCVRNTPPNMHVYSLFIKPVELKNFCLSHSLHIETLRGFRPKFLSLPFLQMLLTRKVSDSFAFRFSKSLATGYSGIAKKSNRALHN
jgi:2-polyprenyl-6-hydroxyphenyl methylase / 3-demethylubiquinone-9 3-methyltransferase